MSGIPASLIEQAVFVYGEFSFGLEALRRLLGKRHLPASSRVTARKPTAGVQEFQAAYQTWLEVENLPKNALNEGRFRFDVWPQLQRTATQPTAPATRQEPAVAIEILREFGPHEFIGKVYALRETAWRPVSPEGASSFAWFQRSQQGEAVYFDMRGSGRWEVEWFRFESSARSPNPYLAIALKQTKAEAAKKRSAIPGS